MLAALSLRIPIISSHLPGTTVIFAINPYMATSYMAIRVRARDFARALEMPGGRACRRRVRGGRLRPWLFPAEPRRDRGLRWRGLRRHHRRGRFWGHG